MFGKNLSIEYTVYRAEEFSGMFSVNPIVE